MGPLEASRTRAFADHAEWNQFYDAESVRRFVGLGRKAEIAQAGGCRTGEPRRDHQSGAGRCPRSCRPRYPKATNDGTRHRHRRRVPLSSQAPSRRCRRQEPPSAPAISAPEQPTRNRQSCDQRRRRSLRCPTGLTATHNAAIRNAGQGRGTRRPRLRPPRPPHQARSPCHRVRRTACRTRPIQLHHRQRPHVPRLPHPCRRCVSARGRSDPEPEQPPERSRPATSSRARAALPRWRTVPQSNEPQRDGTQWIDPQRFGPPQPQFGGQSYAAPQYSAPQYSAQPPGGPQLGPYFPYGSQQPSAPQRSVPQSNRAPRTYSAPAYDPRQSASQSYAAANAAIAGALPVVRQFIRLALKASAPIARQRHSGRREAAIRNPWCQFGLRVRPYSRSSRLAFPLRSLTLSSSHSGMVGIQSTAGLLATNG